MTEAILNWTSAGDYRCMICTSDVMRKRRQARRSYLLCRPALDAITLATLAYIKIHS